MIDRFARWWLQEELDEKQRLIRAYIDLINEYRTQQKEEESK
jgi:hypothetical protein